MNDYQLDAILEYLNDDTGTVSLQETYDILNEGKISDALTKALGLKRKSLKPDTKKGFFGLFNKNKQSTIDVDNFMSRYGLEKVEGKDDLYKIKGTTIEGVNPLVKLTSGVSLLSLATYESTFKMFLDETKKFASDKKYRDIIISSRLKCDVVEVDTLCKNIKMIGILITKGYNGRGYAFYRCQYVISLKCSSMKALKYHTYGFMFDDEGWSDRWWDYPPTEIVDN